MEINLERLSKVMGIELATGGHNPNDSEMCVMEAVSYVAGERWSDAPQCACQVISTFLRNWNDSLPDAERTVLLRPLIPKLIGTKSTPEVELRRSLMAADWLVRTHTPAWLRLAGLSAQADMLAALPEITDMAHVPSLRGPLEAVRHDAAAVGAAAGYAAWAAARAAARAAAGAAAGYAAGAAGGYAAWAAAWAAAGYAVGAAALQKLAATKAELQQSAVALVERMIAYGESA